MHAGPADSRGIRLADGKDSGVTFVFVDALNDGYFLRPSGNELAVGFTLSWAGLTSDTELMLLRIVSNIGIPKAARRPFSPRGREKVCSADCRPRQRDASRRRDYTSQHFRHA
jgi:hypothetical protein